MVLNELALFAGGGGGILASKLLGWNTIGAVEIEDYPRRVLLQRQRDGILEPFPIWDDVNTFDGKPWKGLVDILSGGFPCQDVSAAGKGAGVRDGERSGLWKEYSRIIGEVRPKLIFAENTPLLPSRGMDLILSDLSRLGYHAVWGVLGAGALGAQHKRDRIWILAYSHKVRRCHVGQGAPNKNGNRDHLSPKHVWGSESGVGRVANGLADAVDRLKALGNGQVPIVAAVAFQILMQSVVEVLDEVPETQ